MQVHFGTASLAAEWPGAVVCIGTFDGVHVGHRAVISEAVRQARELKCPCAVVTFDRNPAQVLHPERRADAISSLETNLAVLDSLGVTVCLVLAFDLAFSQTSANEFFDSIVMGALRARRAVVGHDFAMGHGREGTAKWLSERIETSVVEAVTAEGARVSSSRIRAAIAGGDVALAAKLLGRPFEISGVVIGGRKLGRELGYPTVNLARSLAQVYPAHGIYACRCLTERGEYAAATSVGIRPAAGDGTSAIEAYLLDYPGDDLYAQSVTLRFEQRLREERDFADLNALRDQIARDVEQVERIFGCARQER